MAWSQTDVPGLILVDHVDLAGLLPLDDEVAQHQVRVESAEPVHFDVGTVANAVRARKRGDIAERAQVTLVGHTPGKAGHKKSWSPGWGIPRKVCGDVIEEQYQLWSGAVDRQARGTWCTARSGVPLGDPKRPAGQRGRLEAIGEVQLASPPKPVQIDKLGTGPHIGVGPVRSCAGPPHGLDLSQQPASDQRREAGRRVMRARPICPDLAKQAPHGTRHLTRGVAEQ